MKISKNNAEHYIWGDQCDGWHLVKNNELSVIHERMPANTAEINHYHHHARQFFFVLTGTATIEIEGESISLQAKEGIEVPPLKSHQMRNDSNQDVEFLVISQPNSKGDRAFIEDNIRM
ncbi:cupin domain-containing protein [Lysinibacillus sp. NPDC048646]|uniref:cupin domain-containing protein n=1 Tax=Lysinibacillus sp. NPDC048646 TaxID=3390574 RepID=UPI003D07FBB4